MENEVLDVREEALSLLKEKKYTSLRKLFETLNPADIAELMEEFSSDELVVAFRLLHKDDAADCFVEMSPDLQELLINAFSDAELGEVVNDMFLDDAVDMIEEMPANVVKRILKTAAPNTRKMINELLKYPEDSAGSIMTLEYVSLKSHFTVKEAFERIRNVGVDKETIYTCYVTDKNNHLIGIITAKELLLADENYVIGDIMETNIISVKTTEDKELVARQFDKYDLLALPVVDDEDRLVGIVTFDDAIDVLTAEATEDIEKMAAITPTDKPYMKTGVFETFKKRIPWLLFLMLSSAFTSTIITSYETALAAFPVLTAFIPMFMGTGGNASSQTSVTIIRGLSLGEITYRDTFKIIWKEINVSVLCGIVLALANFVKLLVIDQVTTLIALVVCITLVATVLFAKVIGCILPILSKMSGLDPAVMASPLITTVVDAASLVIYFCIASSMLGI